MHKYDRASGGVIPVVKYRGRTFLPAIINGKWLYYPTVWWREFIVLAYQNRNSKSQIYDGKRIIIIPTIDSISKWRTMAERQASWRHFKRADGKNVLKFVFHSFWDNSTSLFVVNCNYKIVQVLYFLYDKLKILADSRWYVIFSEQRSIHLI